MQKCHAPSTPFNWRDAKELGETDVEKPLQWIQLSPGQSLSFLALLQDQLPGLDQSGGGRTMPGWPAPQMGSVLELSHKAWPWCPPFTGTTGEVQPQGPLTMPWVRGEMHSTLHPQDLGHSRRQAGICGHRNDAKEGGGKDLVLGDPRVLKLCDLKPKLPPYIQLC